MVITIVDKQREEITKLIEIINFVDSDIHIVMFTNTVDARLYLQKHPIDLLFTEIDMPFITGIQLFTQIHLIQPSMKVVFIADCEEYAQDVMSTNAFGYLVQPINDVQVQSIIEEIEMG